MVPRRYPVGLILAAVLTVLLAALATVQYRWIGKVAEAEREQLKGSLAQRARDLTDDFDREITRAYLAFQAGRAFAPNWAALADGLQRWRASARFPQMVRGLYLAEPVDGSLTLRRYEEGTRAFAAAADWPAHLKPVRASLESRLPARQAVVEGRGEHVEIVSVALQLVRADVPALLIPVALPLQPALVGVGGPERLQFTFRAPAGTFQWHDAMRAHLIVDLDAEVLSSTVLPALADRHFPQAGTSPFRLAVLGVSGAPLFQRGFATGSSVDATRADQLSPFFALRPDLMRDLVRTDTPGSPPGSADVGRRDVVVYMSGVSRPPAAAESRAGGPAPPVTAQGSVTFPRPGWRLVVQHGAGSLDAAVSSARRRNLWLSFTILAVLAAGVALVVVNARRSEQLAARQMDFVATVSHELRTPLAVIRSAAQNLSAGVVSDVPRAQQYGQLIEDEGRRLTDMVEQVLAYAGLEGSRRVRAPRPVDMQGLVESVTATCRPLCDAAGCALEVDTGGPGMPPVLGDEAALGRALHNLVSNAVKHGADGGWVGVTLSACAVRGRQEVQLTVSDRGRGIDAADLAHIFEPFHRGRHAIAQQIHGNGLGLNLVKRIVEAHAGRIAVTSTPGAGATFAVYLPAGPPVAAEEVGEAP